MEKQKKLLVVSVLAGIEAAFFVIMTLLIYALRNNEDFAKGFADGAGIASYESSDIIGVALIIFLLFTLYSIAKFIVSILAYRFNKKGLIIALVVLCAAPTIYFLFSLLLEPMTIIFLIYIAIQLILAILALLSHKLTTRREEKYQQKQQEEEKTVIEIEGL